MEKRDKSVIKGMYVTLTQDMESSMFLGWLFQEDVLDDEHMEKIRKKKTNKKKNEKLLKILCKRENGLQMLIKALYTTKQDYLGKLLLAKATWTEEEKRCFEDQLDGTITEKQALEMEIARLKQKLSDVEQENQELKLQLSELEKKGNLTDAGIPGIPKHSDPSSSKIRKSFRKSFRKTDQSHGAATHGIGENDQLFSELAFSVNLQIAQMLTSQYSWSILGKEFELDPHVLKSMESNFASSKAEVVLELIKATYPDLTVHEFRYVVGYLKFSKIIELLPKIY